MRTRKKLKLRFEENVRCVYTVGRTTTTGEQLKRYKAPCWGPIIVSDATNAIVDRVVCHAKDILLLFL